MRTALDIVRDLVREEHTLAQRLEVVRAQLGALKQLAGIKPTKIGGRARRSPRRARPPAPPTPEERPVRTEVIARTARGQAIRELLAHARAEAAAEKKAAPPAPAPPPTAPAPQAPRAYRTRRVLASLEPGEVFGCWTVVREAKSDKYGRARVWARAACCGREATKSRGDLERRREACSKCVVRTHRGIGAEPKPKSPRLFKKKNCGTCGQAGHQAVTCEAHNGATSPWVRCKLAVPVTTGAANIQAQGYTSCGALVLAKKREQHLAEVHGLEVAVGDVDQHFDRVDPRQGAGQ